MRMTRIVLSSAVVGLIISAVAVAQHKTPPPESIWWAARQKVTVENFPGKAEDLVRDDQAIFSRVPEGVVVLLGCAHAGVVNTIRYISKLTGENKIYAVMGGTHLITASPARLKMTVAAFRQFGLQKIMLSHCTGVDAYAEIARAFPGCCSWPAAGTQVLFGGPRSGAEER